MTTPDRVMELLQAGVNAADCRRRRVGAVAVDRAQRVVGVGWNGLESGSCTAGECPRGLLTYDELPANSSYAQNCRAIHAEESALRMTEKCVTLYITETPCPGCEVLIEEYGCEAVVVPLPGTSRG